MKKLFLVDISSFIFRAYYAIRPLSAKDGTPVNAVFGVISMMNKLIDRYEPDHLIVCNDRPDKGFRYDIFPEYKANRGAPPEDLVPQFDLIREFITTYPIKAFDKKGYEADDIIATLVEKYKSQKDMEVYIVSSDKDLMQLLDENVFMLDTMKDKVFKAPQVIEKFGVGPERVVDVQSLCGDSVDNIPGIAGVGPKTASKLINEYGSLEAVLDHADEIKGKLGEKVRAGKDDALLSKKLVSLALDVDLDLKWEEMSLAAPQKIPLNDFYERLDFQKFKYSDVEEESGGDSRAKVAEKIKYICITKESQLKDVCKKIKSKKNLVFAFDTETTGLDSLKSSLVGISFCFERGVAYYIPVGHLVLGAENLDLAIVKKHLGPLLADPKLAKVAQNAKYDINILNAAGFSVAGLAHDTLIASYLINPTGQHSLDHLADLYLNHKTIKFSDVVGKGQTFADVPIEEAVNYAAEDAWVTWMICEPLYEKVEELGLDDDYQNVELPLISVLSTMEQNGVLIDQEFLQNLKVEFSDRLGALVTQIYELAGEEFNINSPKQLGVILFDKLGLPVVKKTKTGYSTDVGVLTTLSKEHELPNKLLKYRSLTKLLSTYVEQLRGLLHEKTGRVHTHFNQAIVATGRLSSTEPNLQNIPIRTEEGRRIREAFIVPQDHIMFSADYSQIELRLLADFTKDPKLIQAYQDDEDIHARTAATIMGLDIEDVDAEQRAIGKTINFGVVYGQSAFALSKQLSISVAEAKGFIDGFYREFANVRDYKESILTQAGKDGYVSTYLGRRRYIPDINSQNKLTKQNAERVAFNTVFQGSAADLIKKAMIEIHDKLMNESWKTRLLLQVHDELIFEVPKKELDSIQVWVPEIMEKAFVLDVPLKVSFGVGKNWAEAH